MTIVQQHNRVAQTIHPKTTRFTRNRILQIAAPNQTAGLHSGFSHRFHIPRCHAGIPCYEPSDRICFRKRTWLGPGSAPDASQRGEIHGWPAARVTGCGRNSRGWVNMNPGIGPRVLVHVATYQGNPHFGVSLFLTHSRMNELRNFNCVVNGCLRRLSQGPKGLNLLWPGD